MTPRSTQPSTLLQLIKWVPGISGNLVVKNKLPPHSGPAALRQLNPTHKKGPLKCFFYVRIIKVKKCFCLQIQNESCRFLTTHYSICSPSCLVASRVIPILQPVQTISVALLHPIFFFFTNYFLKFEPQPLDRNGWTLSIVKNCEEREKYIFIVVNIYCI